MFPTLDISENQFISHTEEAVKNFKEFYFVLRCAQIVKDSFSDYAALFLIPKEGYRIFVKLNDTLYTGILGKDLRLNIPFIPHLGIANSIDAKKMQTRSR